MKILIKSTFFTVILMIVLFSLNQSNAHLQAIKSATPFNESVGPLISLLLGLKKLNGKPFFTGMQAETLAFNIVNGTAGYATAGLSYKNRERILDLIIESQRVKNPEGNFRNFPSQFNYRAAGFLLGSWYDYLQPSRILMATDTETARFNFETDFRGVVLQNLTGSPIFYITLKELLTFENFGQTVIFKPTRDPILDDPKLGPQYTQQRISYIVDQKFQHLNTFVNKMVNGPTDKLRSKIVWCVDQEFNKSKYIDMSLDDKINQRNALVEEIMGDTNRQYMWLTQWLFLKILGDTARVEEVLTQQMLVLTHETHKEILLDFDSLIDADPILNLNFLFGLGLDLEFVLSIFSEYLLTLRQFQTLITSLGGEDTIPSNIIRGKLDDEILPKIERTAWIYFTQYYEYLMRGSPSENCLPIAKQFLFKIWQLMQRIRLITSLPTDSYPSDIRLDLPITAVNDDPEIYPALETYFTLATLKAQDASVGTTTTPRKPNGSGNGNGGSHGNPPP